MNKVIFSTFTKSAFALVIASSALFSIQTTAHDYGMKGKPVSSSAYFQHFDDKAGLGKGHKKLKRLAKYLSLAPQQITALRDIFQQYKPDRMERRSKRIDYQQQIEPLLIAENFDEQAFNEIRQQFAQQRSDAALNRAKMRHAMLQVLTPEQQDKFLRLKKFAR